MTNTKDVQKKKYLNHSGKDIHKKRRDKTDILMTNFTLLINVWPKRKKNCI